MALAIMLSREAHGQTSRFAKAGTLIISDGNRRIRVADVSEPIAHVPTAPNVHSIEKWHGQYYVVVTVSHWTRGYPPKGGGGGAGEEAYVKWLCINGGGKVTKSMEGRFRSWSDNREGGVDGWHGPIFTVTTGDLLEDKLQAKEKEVWQTITYSFDAQHPEQGIKEDKAPAHE